MRRLASGHHETARSVRQSPRSAVFEAMAAAAAVVYGSLLPFQFQAGSGLSLAECVGQLAWLRPSIDDLVANLAVYFVLGLLAGRAIDRFRGRTTAAGLVAAVGGCALLSMTVEMLQTMLAARVSSWSDVTLNGLGAAAGTAAWIWWQNVGKSATNGRRRLGHAPFQLAAILVTTAILGWSLAPFDVVRSFAQLEQQFRSAEWDLLCLTTQAPSSAELVHEVNGMLLFVLMGYLAGLAGRERELSPPRAGLWALRHVAVCAVVFELLQLLVRSHTLEATSMVVRSIGGSIGVWLAIGMVDRLSRGHWRSSPGLAVPNPLLALAAWVGIASVAASFLVPEPGVAEPTWAGSLLPFLALWMEPFGVAVTSMSAVLAVFGGIAATLAVPLERAGRPIPWVRAGLTVAAVAATLELIQAIIPGRTVDPTIPLLALGGAVLAGQIAGWARMQAPALVTASH